VEGERGIINGVAGSRNSSDKWKFGGGIFRYNEAISDSFEE